MSDLDQLSVNTIRVLAADTVQKANSGHPGAPMGLAPVGHVLFRKVMNYNPANPKFINRDRFVLSNGHACSLQYILLHLSGFDISLDDLKSFRQLHSKTPGHPESFRTPGIEVSTGPLGQGIANAVGMAIAQAQLAATFNKPEVNVFDNYTYVVCGDGCLQEGVALEAISLAGHQQLDRLILLYDDNKIQIDGSTDLAFTENTPAKFEAQGWHVQEVKDGDHDLAGIESAIQTAKNTPGKPHLIVVKTTIGFASSKQGTEEVHGSPLGAADIVNVKTKLGLDPAAFFTVPESVAADYASIKDKGAKIEAEWKAKFSEYEAKYPNEAAEIKRRFAGELPANWETVVPRYTTADKSLATRESSGLVLNALAPVLTELIGGSADLTPSNKTWLKCSTDFLPTQRHGRYLRFGVREHAMFAIGNGISAYGGFIPFTATFLNFIEYGFGAVRLSALSQHHQVFIMTHDSIGLGEDGPTHQPIEAVSLLRSTPGIHVFRPADSNEVAGSYVQAMKYNGPSVLCLSRQGLPNLAASTADQVALGAYQVHTEKLQGSGAPLVLIATGSEVEVALKAAAELAKDATTPFSSVSVVSAPCLELFNQQSLDYRKQVLPVGSYIVAVEALATNGWERYSHACVGMTTFGESAPTSKLFDFFGFTGLKVAAKTAEYFKALSAATNGVVPPVQVQYM